MAGEENSAITTDQTAAIEAQSNHTPEKQQQHPLENSWTFWFDSGSNKSKQAEWGKHHTSNLHFVLSRSFGAFTLTYIIQASLPPEPTFIVLKIKLSRSGRIRFVLMEGSGQPLSLEGIRHCMALHYLLAMIGEQFDHGDEICGAVVNVRSRQEKISLWTRNASNESAQISIGKQ